MRYSRAITLGLVLAVMACKTSSMIPSAAAANHSYDDGGPGSLLIVNKTTVRVCRSAVSGQIVSRTYAFTHPRTTVCARVKRR